MTERQIQIHFNLTGDRQQDLWRLMELGETLRARAEDMLSGDVNVERWSYLFSGAARIRIATGVKINRFVGTKPP